MIGLDVKINKIEHEQNVINELIYNIIENSIETELLLKRLKQSVDKLKVSARDYDNERQRINPYIVKRVVAHIANGLNVSDAIILTAEEYRETVKRVEVLFEHQKVYMSALNLFAKKYMAEKLKKAGYKTKQVAKIIGVSENHIYKLLRCTNNFWLLSH